MEEDRTTKSEMVSEKQNPKDETSYRMRNDTSLKKKSQKVVQDPNRSQREIFSEKISTLPEAKSKVEEEKNNNNQTINLDLLSSSTSTWSIPAQQESSESKNSSRISFSGRDKSFRINSLDRKDNEIIDNTKSSSSSNFYYICGLCLLLFSLSVLIFCGKVCAIFCTSTWFYFVSTTTTRTHIEDFFATSHHLQSIGNGRRICSVKSNNGGIFNKE